ncbi:MAG: RagB/SusD family nutrient uptake outer membrane protein [Longimicrobiales bacterium]
MNHRRMLRRGVWTLGLAVLAAGCGDLFDIENPGEILDDDLNDPELIDVLITGLSSDVSDFVDNVAFDVARLSDEMAGSGSYADTGYFRTGWAEQGSVGGIWDQAHEAVWMSELHIERIEGLLEPGEFSASDPVSRALVFEGVAHRTLGENYCQVVYSDPDEYGSLQPRTVAFDSALVAFNQALTFGSEHHTAARAGLASVYAAKGDWAQAVSNAQQVPDDFEWYAYYDINDNANIVYDETHDRAEMSAFNTLAGSMNPQDPRAPFTKCEEGGCSTTNGADGVTTMWRQEKVLDEDDEIIVLSGKEARLIEAEAALVAGDLEEFTTQINRVRALYGLDPIDEPATAGSLEFPNAWDDAWSILDGERHLTLWLEGRRLWDLHRWDHPFLDGGQIVWEPEPRRDSCMPVPQGECSVNPNFTCNEAAAGTNSG